jgi:DNA polymerase-3 subunit delta
MLPSISSVSSTISVRHHIGYRVMRRQLSTEARKSREEFDRHLQTGKIAPVYLFEGDESYLRKEALDRLSQQVIDQTVRDFNVSEVSASNDGLVQALAIARQLPLISSRRIVILTGFETINEDRELEVLDAYLCDPSPSTVFVFVTDGLDNRRRLTTLIRSKSVLVSFKPIEDREAPGWIAERILRAGVSIDASDANFLVATVGTDLQRLLREADKLTTYVGPGGRIRRGEIEKLVRYSREHTNFDISDAVLEGNREKALRLVDRIFSEKSESPQTLSILILGTLGGVFRRMLAAKELITQGAPNEEVARVAGLPSFKVGAFNERVRRMSMETIIRGVTRIAETDVALKSSLATPRLQIEMLICELCPQAADRYE